MSNVAGESLEIEDLARVQVPVGQDPLVVLTLVRRTGLLTYKRCYFVILAKARIQSSNTDLDAGSSPA